MTDDGTDCLAGHEWCPGPNNDESDELPCSTCFIEGGRLYEPDHQ